MMSATLLAGKSCEQDQAPLSGMCRDCREGMQNVDIKMPNDFNLLSPKSNVSRFKTLKNCNLKECYIKECYIRYFSSLGKRTQLVCPGLRSLSCPYLSFNCLVSELRWGRLHERTLTDLKIAVRSLWSMRFLSDILLTCFHVYQRRFTLEDVNGLLQDFVVSLGRPACLLICKVRMPQPWWGLAPDRRRQHMERHSDCFS